MRNRSLLSAVSLLLGLVGIFTVDSTAAGEELTVALSKSTLQDLETMAHDLRDGGPDFVPWPEAWKKDRRQQLETALEELDALLRRSGEDRETGWKKYLRWEVVQDQLNADQADIRKLQPVLGQFYRNENGLEMKQFTGVRDALRDYMNALLFQDATRAKTAHAAQLGQLSKRLDAYIKNPSSEDAWKRAGRTKGRANSIASSHAELRVEESVDAQAAKMLNNATTTYQEQFRKPLIRRDGFPKTLAAQSNDEELRIQVIQRGRFQVASPSAPPKLIEAHDLAVRIHESLVRNLSESALAGVTLTDERLEQMLQEAGVEIPEELQVSPDRESWSITFSSARPISVEFRQDRLTIAIRGRKFTQGDRVFSNPIRIAATYQVEKMGAGSKLTRIGDVTVDFIGRTMLNARQIAFRTVLRRKFGALFKPEFSSNGLQLPGAMEKVGKLEVAQLSSRNGWFVLTWKIPEKAIKTAGLK